MFAHFILIWDPLPRLAAFVPFLLGNNCVDDSLRRVILDHFPELQGPAARPGAKGWSGPYVGSPVQRWAFRAAQPPFNLTAFFSPAASIHFPFAVTISRFYPSWQVALVP